MLQKEKENKYCAFRRQLNEKPSIIRHNSHNKSHNKSGLGQHELSTDGNC